jgi:dUTP pyrophosphatase
MGASIMYTAVEFIKTHPDAVIPKAATEGAAGMDLTSVETIQLNPGQRALINTGLKIALEGGYEAQVRPRSGLALKHGVTVLNSPGTIDADYRGPVGVILINHGDESFKVNPGDRVAQLVVKPVEGLVVPKHVQEFSDPKTKRGEAGYGSTG